MTLALEGVAARYGDVAALAGIDLVVAAGERLAILGPSGSGKSTLLRVVAGLEPPAAGRVTWNGRDLAGVPPHRRGFGLMFQDYVLFPHRDVAGNVAFGLQMRGDGPAETRRRVAEVLEMVGLTGYERRGVTELSGGEQQRVALARALAPSPALLMLDEPLGALDRSLRQRLLDELDDLFESLGLTILYVTHDQQEALAIGHRVALLRAGTLEAVLPPEELWRRPPTEFAARFLGLNNIADAEVDAAGTASTPWAELVLPAGAVTSGRKRLLIRPDGLVPASDGEVRGIVVGRRFRGDHVVLEVAVGTAPPLVVNADWPDPPGVGDEIRLAVLPTAIVALPGGAG